MASFLLIASLLLQTVASQNAPYGQCGGSTFNGDTTCSPGWICTYWNSGWSDCQQAPTPPGMVAPWAQCGGSGWTGLTVCSPGNTCVYNTMWWSRCEPNPYTSPGPKTTTSSSTKLSSSSSIKATTSSSVSSSVGMTSSTKSALSSVMPSTKFVSTITTSTAKLSSLSSSTSSVKSISPTSSASVIKSSLSTLMSSSLPSSSSIKSSLSSSSVLSSTSTKAIKASTTLISSTKVATSTSTIPASPTYNCAVQNPPPPSAGKVTFSGINLAGCEYQINAQGWWNYGTSWCPTGLNGHPNGPGQMAHFVTDDHFNTFRLPVTWQFLINSNTASSTLDPTNWAEYDFLVTKCLATGAYCVVSVHNFAWFNGQVIGQGGPSNALFAGLWGNIAAKYAGNSKVIFGLMNEPQSVPNIMTWAGTCQAAVNAIRAAETVSHTILLPGNNYASAQQFISSGSAAALSTITNPTDLSFTNLIFDVHKYLDSDNSGTSAECSGNYIAEAFAPLAQWLRCNGRRAFLTEIGGGNTGSCKTYLCQALDFINANSDVYIGYLGWGAGSLTTSYVLSMTPYGGPGTWSDQWIVTQCMLPK